MNQLIFFGELCRRFVFILLELIFYEACIVVYFEMIRVFIFRCKTLFRDPKISLNDVNVVKINNKRFIQYIINSKSYLLKKCLTLLIVSNKKTFLKTEVLKLFLEIRHLFRDTKISLNDVNAVKINIKRLIQYLINSKSYLLKKCLVLLIVSN